MLALINIGPTLGIVVILLALWQAGVALFRFPGYLLPSPTTVASVFMRQLPVLWRNGLVTSEEFALGFGLSVVAGIPLGMAGAKFPLFTAGAYPLLVASQSIPKLALAPLFAVWFGFGLLPKVLIAFLIAFFPITVNTVVGLRSVEADVVLLSEAIGLTSEQRFLKIELPAALPGIFAGLKVATTFAVVGAVVGEFLGADAGLGHLTLTASTMLNTPLLFAGLTALAIVGVVSYGVVSVTERLAVPWYAMARDRMLPGTL